VCSSSELLDVKLLSEEEDDMLDDDPDDEEDELSLSLLLAIF
jgi:hypothetical protein